MDTFKKRWQNFLSLIFDPWTLCFLIATTVLIILGHGQQNVTVSTMFTVLITLSSAVLGGRAAKHWVDITEGGVVKARGKSAVRGLKLLFGNVTSLDQRLERFLGHCEKDQPLEIIKTWIEEVSERTRLIAEEVVSSIENWTDIIPEADIKTHIGELSALTAKLDRKEAELKEIQEELNQTKDTAKEEREKLRKGIHDKEKEMADLQEQVRKSRISFGTGVYSSGGTLTVPPSASYEYMPFSSKLHLGADIFKIKPHDSEKENEKEKNEK